MSQPSSALIDQAPLLLEAAPAQADRRQHLHYLEAFRALAIVLIVAGHAFDLAFSRVPRDALDMPLTLSFIQALVTGGTFYFVFISGFLYRHVFHDRLSYAAFLRKKAVQIGVPYLVLGTLLAFVQVWYGGFHVTLTKHDAFYGESVFLDVASQLLTGAMMTGYWYIPFAAIVFLASPLFDRFIRLSVSWQLAILAGSIGAALVAHRPYESLDPVHSFVYFANAYLIGILFCQYRDRIVRVLSASPVLAASGLALAAIALYQTLGTDTPLIIERSTGEGLMPEYFDWTMLQKYVGIALIFGLLARFCKAGGGVSSLLARYSFGLYFIHGIVLAFMAHMPLELSPHVGTAVIDFMLYALLALGISLAVVVATKKLMGPSSRYLIGC